jgi:hypothetical protein
MTTTVDQLKYWVQTVVPLVYDDSLSLYELVNKTVQKVNELITQSNEYFSQDLSSVVGKILEDWNTSGKLADVINQSLFDSKADKSFVDQTKADLDAEISTVQAALSTNTASLSTLSTKVTNLKYYGTPEEFGAVADGITDDTQAIQNCLNGCVITLFSPKTYRITKTLTLPDTHSIDGNHAELKVFDIWTNINNGPDVPQSTMLWVKGRQPVAGSEMEMTTRFIRNLRFRGVEGIPLVGIFCGAADQSVITDASCVNYAVWETNFHNLTFNYMEKGLYLAEVWGCSFEKINTPNSTNAGLYIKGQIVNNTFTACQFSGVNYGVYVDGAYYVNGSVLRRPEGCVFLGGFIGVAKWGINFVRGLAFKFTSVIIDLNSVQAVIGTDFSDVTFESCWLYSDGRVIDISGISTIDNGTFVVFSHCNLVTGGSDPENYTVKVNVRQNGVIFDGCKVQGRIYYDDAASGIVKNCIWGDTVTVDPRIIKNATGNLIMSDNMFKTDGSLVPTSRL